jgi:hypothetical protein
MKKFFTSPPAWLKRMVCFGAWAVIFGLIYGQSPLYTSNQNQYFLHGLARAGQSYLSNDWLANTLDPIPLFSGLVYATIQLFRSDVLFYLYYALLVGVYMAAILGIIDTVFRWGQEKTKRLIFVVLFLVVHSAALHFFLSRILGTETPFLIEGGFADQRLLGQVLQPSTFGVFLILSISLFIREKIFQSLLSLAVAIYFHPVYLLSGAMLTLAYLWVIFRQENNVKSPLKLGLITFLLVSPVLIYTIIVFRPTSPEMIREVNEFLVHFRNPHHAIVSEWLNWTSSIKAAIIFTTLIVVRRTRLFPILSIMTLGMVLLTILQVITNNNSLALIYPWRISILLVPISTSILVAFLVSKLFEHWKLDWGKNEPWLRLAGIMILGVLIIIGITRFQIEHIRQLESEDHAMMAYVAEHKSFSDLYLVPAKMENFRLATGAPIFVDFKSVPYRDTDVMEWYRRIRLVNTFYTGEKDPCESLQTFATREGITHMVLDEGDRASNCPDIELVYWDEYYTVFSLEAYR